MIKALLVKSRRAFGYLKLIFKQGFRVGVEQLFECYQFIGIDMPLTDFYFCQRAAGYIAALSLQFGRKRFLREFGFYPQLAYIFTYSLFDGSIHIYHPLAPV